MSDDDKEERRALLNVQDKPVEYQSMAQTILTFLMLGVMSWVGLTLEKVKDNTATLTTKTAVIDVQVANNRELMLQHINNKRVHLK